VQLARWHYQKALAAGQPHNPELEKVLGGNFVRRIRLKPEP